MRAQLWPIIITLSLSLCVHRSLRLELRNTSKEISVSLLCGRAQYLPCLKLKSYSGWVVSLFLLFYNYLFMRLYLAIGCWHGWKGFSNRCFVCGMNKVICIISQIVECLPVFALQDFLQELWLWQILWNDVKLSVMISSTLDGKKNWFVKVTTCM